MLQLPHPLMAAAPQGAASACVAGAAWRGRAARGDRRAGVLRWFVRSSVRRTFAALLAFAVLSFSFETLIPDVHDGDAPRAELARSAGGPMHLAGSDAVADGHALGTAVAIVHGSAAAMPQPDASAPPSSGREPTEAPGPEHAAHVCHGTHEHLAPAPSLPPAGEIVSDADLVVQAYAVRIVSRSVEPPVRPPIA